MEETLDGYPVTPTIILVLGSVMLAYIIVSRFKVRKGFDVSSSLIALFSLVEWVSKLLMIGTFYELDKPGAMALCFMTVLTNCILALMLKVFYMGLFEDHLKTFKKFKEENRRFYKISGFLMIVVGPNFCKILNAGLWGIPKSKFEGLTPYRMS